MAKASSVFYCTECGNETAKWVGKCPVCGTWNSMVEGAKKTTGGKSPNKSSIKVKAKTPKKLHAIEVDKAHRTKTGMDELDRVLGGGLVQGSVVLLGGDPGIGKSTLLLQICDNLAKTGTVLYVSGEESESQIKLRADRIGSKSENVWLLATNDLQDLEENITDVSPKVVIVDSIQTMYRQEVESAPGSVSQVREVTASLTYMAKQTNTTVIIVGHVTKEGNIAGPKILEHLVDTVLYFEGDKYESYRVLRAEKNRFGSTNEIGVFEMMEVGFREIDNPSGLFISESNKDETGRCVACAVEGTRPMLFEMQALVSETSFGNPRRMATGIDNNRMILMATVLEKKTGLRYGDQDIYINIVGGFKVTERAADLAIVMSIVSSLKNKAIDRSYAFIGEVSLTGELRPVSYIEKRVQECKRMGFEKIIIPKGNMTVFGKDKNIIGAENISNVINTVFPRE